MRIRPAARSRWAALAVGVFVVASATASGAARHTNALRAPAKRVATASKSATPAGASGLRKTEPAVSRIRRGPAAPSVAVSAPSPRLRVSAPAPSGIKWSAPQPAAAPAGIKWSAPEPAPAASGIKWSSRSRGR